MSKIKFIPKTAEALAVQYILPPVITILGDNPHTLKQNETYVDAGATALDAEDGLISPAVWGTVNNQVAGSYTIVYTATDRAGNSFLVG